MRFLVALVLVLGLLALTSAQSVSNTNSNSVSVTVTNTVSNTVTNTISATVTATNSGSATVTNSGTQTISSTQSNTNTVTRSASNTVSVTSSWTPTMTGTGTATVTYPTPQAPSIGGNGCPDHIEFLCPFWTDPAGFTFNIYRVYYQNTFSSVITTFTTTLDSARIGPGLSPNTQYNVWVAGADTGVGVWSFNSTVVTFTTAVADPKKDPTLDVQNFLCVRDTNPDTGRGAVSCSWTAAQETVVRINFKVKCVSSGIREPTFTRRRVYGANANDVTAFFAVNRDVGTCTVKARFFYNRRPTTRKISVVTL